MQKLLELINEFGNVTGYKINIQKGVVFQYTNSKLSGRELKKTIPSIITSKGINIPRNKSNYGGKRSVLWKL